MEELGELLEDTGINQNLHDKKDKENCEYAEWGNDTQDMKMGHPEEDMILDDD